MSTLPAPVIRKHESLWVVRDDLLPGGTKRRIASLLFEGCDEVVWQSPAEGTAQVALAYAARDCGKRVTVFTAARRDPHPYTKLALALGAHVEWIRPGRLTVVTKRARDYAAESAGRRLVPLGFDFPFIVDALAEVCASALAELPERPSEVWSVAGKGVLSRALQRAAPDAEIHAVRVGRSLSAEEIGRATLYDAPEVFGDHAVYPPPFPSNPYYDAKAWRFLCLHASPNAAFWNVAT